MKILIESYNTVTQNISGGVQIKIKNLIHQFNKSNVEAHLFNKWEDKISDFDILHIFKLNIEDFHLVQYAKSIGVPVVVSTILPLEKKIQINLNRLMCKVLPIHTGYSFMDIMLNLVDAVIVESQKEAEFIIENYKIEKDIIHIIPNGVSINITNGNPELIKKIIKNDKEIILQVGRFDHNKNQLNVIRAMKNTNIPIVFIGGASSMEIDYFDQCMRNSTNIVNFLGWLKNDDPLLASAYANARVVVLPSFKETFGISLIEGGAAGANLVATRDLPIIEWGLSDFCLGINPHDKMDIRKGLIQAYNNPRNPELPEFIRKTFSWDAIAKKHIEIYTNILNQSAS